MISIFRNCLKMSTSKITKFISYTPGSPTSMGLSQRQIKPEVGEVLMRVRAVGINRAQCLHRQGKYKIGKPVESYLGLQASGEVYNPQTHQKLFDGIALLSGGSYAEWAVIPASHVMPLPKNLNFLQGAAIPEAWLTAFQLLRLAGVQKDHNIVVYAGGSGVGTAAIQLGKLLGANVWSVVSTQEKGNVCLKLGASGVVFYKGNDTWAKELVQKKGGLFDAVLDCVGPDNTQSTLQLLKLDGKWVLFGLLSGANCNINLAALLGKRINLISTTLKTRSDQYKNQLISDFTKTALPAFQDNTLKPIIFKTFNCDWNSPEAFVQAHQLMESNVNFGKIMIEYK